MYNTICWVQVLKSEVLLLYYIIYDIEWTDLPYARCKWWSLLACSA